MKFDRTLLERAGLGELPDAEKTAYLQAFYDRLELAVATRLVAQLTDERLDEFERIAERSQELALVWMRVNCPDYRRVSIEEFDRLSAELTEQADQILSLETTFARS